MGLIVNLIIHIIDCSICYIRGHNLLTVKEIIIHDLSEVIDINYYLLWRITFSCRCVVVAVVGANCNCCGWRGGGHCTLGHPQGHLMNL